HQPRPEARWIGDLGAACLGLSAKPAELAQIEGLHRDDGAAPDVAREHSGVTHHHRAAPVTTAPGAVAAVVYGRIHRRVAERGCASADLRDRLVVRLPGRDHPKLDPAGYLFHARLRAGDRVRAAGETVGSGAEGADDFARELG